MFTKRNSWLSFGACCLLQLAVASPAAQAASAASSTTSGGSPVDVNFFYDTLKDDGSWFNTTDYGDVWQPYIAYKSDSWRPYTDGYWTYTDGGWMFVSNENFGWAVYHYGRWTRLKDIGWAWVPGTDWAPAWVTWRTSNPDGAQVAATGAPTDDKNSAPDVAPADNNAPPPAPREGGSRAAASENYIGWAPLPPVPIAYGADYSYGPTVDVDFGIDPYDYCFTDYRYFGAPYIATVIFDPFRSYDCCERSVNITNIYYNRRGGYRGFYNGGPNYDHFRGVTERPIPQYQLRRSTSASLAQRDIRAGQFNRINGNTLNVAAPQFSGRNVKNGRVNFTQRGALPVTPVSHGAPASVANDERYKRAQESFKRQGETVRAPGGGHGGQPNAAQGLTPGAGRPDAPRIATTPAAQRQERQARQSAERAAGPGRSPDGNRPDGAVPTTQAERRAARQAAREGNAPAPAAAANGEARAARQAARQTARGNGAPVAGSEQTREARRAARAAEGAGRQERAAAGNAEAAQAREARRASRQESRQPMAPMREARVREAAPRQQAPREVPQAPRGGGGGGGGNGEGEKKKKVQH